METSFPQSEPKRMQFGNRYLTDTSNVFEHNAWDDVQWDEEQEKEASEKVMFNSSVMISPDEQERLDREASTYWNSFYEQHENRFFKDRNWLFTEFHELAISPENKATDKCDCTLSAPDNENSWPGRDAHTRILEVGCGVGNTVFPILQTNSDPGVFVYCCDFAKSAVDLVKDHPGFDPNRCHPFVFDVVDDKTSFPFPDGTLDFVILIFVFSAIHPERMKFVFSRLSKLLKPGGMILFRDYGRYDMAQLRFKQGKCLGENFYLRGDGTRVYFFTQDEMREMAKDNGLTELQNHIDRRLQVNRGKKLKMYRIWIQCKFQKPK